MVEGDRFPGSRLVARLALSPEIFLVFVIFLVATDTGHGEFLAFSFQLGRVTGVAFDLFVLAFQRKFGIPVMAEFGRLPFLFVVTSRTIGAQSALVHIIFAVASYTRSRGFCLGEQRRRMA